MISYNYALEFLLLKKIFLAGTFYILHISLSALNAGTNVVMGVVSAIVYRVCCYSTYLLKVGHISLG